MKGDNSSFIFIVVILLALGIGWYSTTNPSFFKNILGDVSSGFFYDPYLIEEDFSIPSASFQRPAASNPKCLITENSWICNDGKWEVTGGSDKYCGYDSIISQGNLIIAGCDKASTSTYLPNLKNRDIKISAKVTVSGTSWGGCTGGSAGITLGSQEVWAFEDSICGNSEVQHTYTIEMIKDVSDKNKFAVMVNGVYKKDIIITGDIAQLSFSSKSPLGVGGKSIAIDYIKSKPYFSCQTDNNEVWVSDSFAEGSTFGIHSLTYEPTKFCPQDYPAVVRDYEERGTKADYRGTITERLTRGESFTIPQYQSYEIRYATTYKEGMGARCGIDEVYSTKTKTCVKKIFEQDYIIKDCSTNPEICDSTYAEYCDTTRKVCVRPYKTVIIVRDREIMPIGKNQKSFINDINIGDKKISSHEPDFTCSSQGEDWNFPNPSKDCWQTTVNALGKSYTMKDMEEIELSNYLKLRVYISGHYNDVLKRVDTYTNNFMLTIKDFNLLQTEPIKTNDYYLIKDASKEMCFNIINNLGIDFSSEQAGYSLKKTTDLITMQTTINKGKALPSGTSSFCIPVDTARYGEIVYQITPYFKIGDETFFDDEQIVYNYKVVDKIPVNETVVFKTNDSVIEPILPIPPATNWILYILLGVVVIFILLLVTSHR